MSAETPLLPPDEAGITDTSSGGYSLAIPNTSAGERRRGYVPPPRKQGWIHAAAILVAELVGTGEHPFALVHPRT